MTQTANARTAGITFLIYFAAVMIPVLGTGDQHLRILLGLVGQFSAVILGVTLYGLTREQDPDIAVLGLVCRVAEGLIGATVLPLTLAMASLEATSTAASGDASSPALAAFLASVRTWNVVVSALFFAVGSTAFAWLLLRGRMIPTGLAWLGVVSSILMTVSLPLQLAGILRGPVMEVTSLPIVFFELPPGVWLIAKGVAPARRDVHVAL
jgi:hypothetical protein